MNTYKLTKLVGALTVTGLLAGISVSAVAGPTCPETLDPAATYKCIYFNVGTSFSPADANSVTSSFYQLGYTGTLATSIYTPFAASAPSGPVVDSNIKKVINYYGLSGGPTLYTPISGVPPKVSLKDTPDFPGQKNIDSLNGPAAGRDTERFDPQDDLGGLGWGLTYEYLLFGALGSSGPSFTSGYFNVFFQNWTNGTSEQVLRVNVTGSDVQPANLDLFGVVSYDWKGGALDAYGLDTPDGVNDCTSTLCQNFFNFQTMLPPEFYSLEGAGIKITMALDSNVKPPIPTPDQLVAFTGTDGKTYWIRQTTLDGSIEFNVPEPGSLALVGLSLAGLGFVGRRRRNA